ncbi:hypothetical protein ES703_64231 [subsurface metagenome]
MTYYRIELNPEVEKFLGRLSKDIALRIIKKIKQLRKDLFHYLKHYEGKDVYKLRIGDYRALIDMDFKNKILKVRVLDKRGRIYKR